MVLILLILRVPTLSRRFRLPGTSTRPRLAIPHCAIGSPFAFWEISLCKRITPFLLLLAETTVVRRRVQVLRHRLQGAEGEVPPLTSRTDYFSLPLTSCLIPPMRSSTTTTWAAISSWGAREAHPPDPKAEVLVLVHKVTATSASAVVGRAGDLSVVDILICHLVLRLCFLRLLQSIPKFISCELPPVFLKTYDLWHTYPLRTPEKIAAAFVLESRVLAILHCPFLEVWAKRVSNELTD